MGIHDWARDSLRQALADAVQENFTEEQALRAMLSVVVERSAALRSADDLAQELIFLADNLDPDRDYTFMRP
ncbi:hypothetical protein [Metapseudomonas boanensis]|uniref:Uncharacterized protein n=1 Tax=Metapseudomonas boanensis TaxID=2822138 RepID=A0ABS5XF61_9GAMM|nr:hypothetical protein [Pseudomonas boanensis]MBT8766318.1 hypothetical protein [Pseudomonas boanensis]